MLKFPAAQSKPWFSAVERPKPTVRTDRDRVSSRPRTNKTAQIVKLRNKRTSFKILPSFAFDLKPNSELTPVACSHC